MASISNLFQIYCYGVLNDQNCHCLNISGPILNTCRLWYSKHLKKSVLLVKHIVVPLCIGLDNKKKATTTSHIKDGLCIHINELLMSCIFLYIVIQSAHTFRGGWGHMATTMNTSVNANAPIYIQ